MKRKGIQYVLHKHFNIFSIVSNFIHFFVSMLSEVFKENRPPPFSLNLLGGSLNS